MPSANNIAYTAPINPPGETPLSRDQVWAGLLLKIRSAETFVPSAIESTEVLSESVEPSTGNAVTIREVAFRDSKLRIQETVMAFEPCRVEFEQANTSVSNVISEGADGSLYLTYIFEWRHPGCSPEELAKKLGKEKRMSQLSVEGTIKVLRQLAEAGRL
ncbi:Protein of unknown function DUF1857 [Penicillium chermesinum]|uniref:DUF1857-domain-containing protein n=1 Tax=Penicillium chermesinum TaxID=63820 RepID=A0A9W9NV03_9EURO|nr:Protein of unknown function DUF1857 [Penicillium chermesinum]KAJ5225189.1 Protein of unknown function DUF1857 [Penicillium chermesinum]KAJ6140503.1 Protein of unknown function DUF1857 [Penicillium chermesinum]